MRRARLAPVGFAALACLLLAAPAMAEPEIYTIDAGHTFPSFEISHVGFSIQRGRFNRTSGQLVLDLAAKSGSVDVVIDAASIDTGLEALEKVLRSGDFFDVEWFPTIVYRSSRLVFAGERLTAVDGELTMLGVTQPLTLAVDHFRCGLRPVDRKPTCGANATATLRRSEFGLNRYVPLLADEVRIVIQVEANRD